MLIPGWLGKALPRPRTPWDWVLLVASTMAGVGMLPFLGLIAARLFSPDSNLILIWANAYTFWIYLPAYPVAVAALALRRWMAGGLAVVVVAFHFAWVLPDYRPAESIPAEARSAPRLRLMTANVFYENPDESGIADEVLDVDPDVLFFQEFNRDIGEALEANGAAARLPFRQAARGKGYNIAIYSRFPFEDIVVLPAGTRGLIRATVRVEGIEVVLYDVHPSSPSPGETGEDWNAEWKAITAMLNGAPGPLIVAGDFNMNQHHRWYRKLKDQGLDNCHEERGRGDATTWPKNRKLRPIRIDQVFHSEGVVCLSIREGKGEGSDHRPLIAELAILP